MRTTRGTTDSILTATLPSCRGAGARVPPSFANSCPISWPRHPIFSMCYPKKYKQGCGSGSAWIRINLSCWIRAKGQGTQLNHNSKVCYPSQQTVPPYLNRNCKMAAHAHSKVYNKSVFRIRIDPDSIRSMDPYPDPGGQKCIHKYRKSTEFSCFEVLDVLF
jgi:hypothetical protein